MLQVKIRLTKRNRVGVLTEVTFDATPLLQVLEQGEIFGFEFAFNNLYPNVRMHINVTEETPHSDSQDL